MGLVTPSTQKEPAWRLGDCEAAQDEENAGWQRDPEDSPPGLLLEIEERGGVGGCGDGLDAVAVVDAYESRGDDAKREHPLENSCAFAAV